jgi:large subunit ribosomal protein L17
MRHNKSGRQFGRNSSHRRAMLRALTANLIAHERIETTEAKAKELRRVAERVITKARRLGAIAYTPNDKLSLADRARRLAAQQQVGKFLQRFTVVTESADDSEKIDLIEKVFVDLAARYKDRAGGYTRIMKTGNRRGDNAPMSIIELVDRDKKVARAEAGSGAETKAAPKAKAAAKPAKAEAGEAAPKAKKAKAEGDKPEKAAKKKASE